MINLCELTGRDKDHLIQKCLPIEQLKGTLKFPLLCSEKLDGVFCLARYNPLYERPNESTELVTIYSRTGEVYKSMEHLKGELLELLMESDSDYLIFEAYTEGVKQNVISGWCRDTKNQHPELKAYVHDCLSDQEFTGEGSQTYEERLEYLQVAFERTNTNNCFLVKQFLVYNQEQIDKAAIAVWSRDGEGLVLRDPNAPWCPGKRNATMLKVKKGVSYDLKVVALEEGKGKYTGMLGKLVCRWRDGETIKVGSGLTDKQRKEWWNEFNYDAIVGKIVQIDAMKESAKGKLREPRFKGIRHDKTEGDF